MRIVLQRVSRASVEVDGAVVGQIGRGVLVFVGVGQGDSEDDALWLAKKTVGLRVFPDDFNKMNRSLLDVGGSALVVSQFTLLGDCRKGRRPAFTDAAEPESAKHLYLRYADFIAEQGVAVATGVFAANMKVSLVNEGPVTMLLER